MNYLMDYGQFLKGSGPARRCDICKRKIKDREWVTVARWTPKGKAIWFHTEEYNRVYAALLLSGRMVPNWKPKRKVR